MRINKSAFLIALSTFWGFQALASPLPPLPGASASAEVDMSFCSLDDSNSDTASVDCGPIGIMGSLVATGRASAGNGTVSSYASTWFHVPPDNSGAVYIGPAFAQAVLVDYIRVIVTGSGVPVNSGSMEFEFDLLGSVSGGRGFADVSVNKQPVFSYDSNFDGAANVVSKNKIPIFEGVTEIFLGTSGRAACPRPPDGATCFSASDLGSSLRVTGLSIFDDAGNDITPSVTVESSSGFDYVTGAEPHDRSGLVAPIPIPASWTLVLLGLGSLISVRRFNRTGTNA